jgi:hypothetical protein
MTAADFETEIDSIFFIPRIEQGNRVTRNRQFVSSNREMIAYTIR